MALYDMTNPDPTDEDSGANPQGSNLQPPTPPGNNPPTNPPVQPPTAPNPNDDDEDSLAGMMFMGFMPGPPSAPGSNPFTSQKQKKDDDNEALNYLINYNDKFASSTPALFREATIDSTEAVLISKSKPNVLLVGAPGVGKTHIVEDIARRIVADEVPDHLKNFTIYELPASALVSGASLVGQMEERLESIINFASDPANAVILFIDEIHQLINASDPSMGKVAQMLKPALARGDMKVIGATTSNEARQIDNDPAFKRRFSTIIVPELSVTQTTAVLKHCMGNYTAHFDDQVIVPNDIIATIVDYADQYNRVKNHRPDNALTLLDKSLAHTVIQRDHLATMASTTLAPTTLKSSMVERVAKQLMTGHHEPETTTTEQLCAALATVKNQQHVIDKVTHCIEARNLGLFPQTKPLSFLFAGASGVGKTKVAEVLAEVITHGSPILLNMAEYHDPSSINRIIGSPDGYVGSTSHREKPLDSLESNPYQVIVLDEFEKAHRDVQNLFLSAFDKGTIDSAAGKQIDLSKAIVVATTNAGRDSWGKASLGFNSSSANMSELSGSDISAKLGAAFPKELVARFSHVLAFNRIEADVYANILRSYYTTQRERIVATKPQLAAILPADLAEDIIQELVATTWVPEHGARPAHRAIEGWITSTVMAA